jgi:Raf kinase inhibitor-like YbhB/YbcL family protein
VALSIEVTGFGDGERIPAFHAFCESRTGMGGNRNPAVRWSGAPDGTRSFALLCIDPDAPTDPTNVNKDGVTVPADLPRADFAHWVLVDIPATVTGIDEGADAHAVTPKGKPVGATPLGTRGANDYTHWFLGDYEMQGVYGGYDGPCPPWNDERLHHYVFTVYALDVESLGLSGLFGASEARAAMQGHVLDSASWTGTYSLNPERFPDVG